MSWLKTLHTKLKKNYRFAVVDEFSLTEKVNLPFKIYALILGLLVFFVLGFFISYFIFSTNYFKYHFFDGEKLEKKNDLITDQIEVISSLNLLVQEQDNFIESIQKVTDISDSTIMELPEQSELENSDNEKSESMQKGKSESKTESVDDFNIKMPSNFSLEKFKAELLPKLNAYALLTNFYSPLNGVISRKFDPKKKHYGVDLVAHENALIKSVADGYVILSEWSDLNGYVVAIAHKENMISVYKHNSQIFKKTSEYVLAGEAIAVAGNSGTNTSGEHLHFELWINGKPVNPVKYINLKR